MEKMKNYSIEDTKLQLKQIIVDDLNVPIKLTEIKDDVSLYDGGLGLDSITIVNFIVSLEKVFDVDFDSNEISGSIFSDISSLAEFITAKRNVKVDEEATS